MQPKIKQYMMAQHPCALVWREAIVTLWVSLAALVPAAAVDLAWQLGRRDRVRLISELGAKCPPSKVRRTGDADEAFIGKRLAAMRGTKLKPKRYEFLRYSILVREISIHFPS